jgi:hypothetical protein
MEDLLYVAVVIVFFAIAALFVVGCDKLIGPDDVALEEDGGGVTVIALEHEREAA